jgi:hypothetical protein
MSVTVELPPFAEEVYRRLAEAQGIPLEVVVRDALIANLPRAQADEITPADPEEWISQFSSWAQSHAQDNLPVLSDEAIDREFIYRDRGL